MAGGTWTPTDALLHTVKEFQAFSTASITYFELVTMVDPATQVETQVEVYFPVYLTQVTPQDTVTTVNGAYTVAPTVEAPYPPVTPASLSGLYRYIFYDTVIYRDFNETIKTLTGTATLGTWQQLDMNDCYQMVEFIPDTVRYRQFQFLAEAKDKDGVVVSTMTYLVDVSDRNWTPGMNALRNAIAIIRARGN